MIPTNCGPQHHHRCTCGHTACEHFDMTGPCMHSVGFGVYECSCSAFTKATLATEAASLPDEQPPPPAPAAGDHALDPHADPLAELRCHYHACAACQAGQDCEAWDHLVDGLEGWSMRGWDRTQKTEVPV